MLQEAAASSTAFINETQQCFAVKAGLSDFLDLARVTFSRTTEAIHTLVDKYKIEHELESLKVRQNAVTPGKAKKLHVHSRRKYR